MSSRIKLNEEDIVSYIVTLLDIPAECIAFPLLEQLDLASAAALRMVSRCLRRSLDAIRPALSLLRSASFISARGDAAPLPMLTWLRDACPARWSAPLLWVLRALKQSNFGVLDFLAPPPNLFAIAKGMDDIDISLPISVAASSVVATRFFVYDYLMSPAYSWKAFYNPYDPVQHERLVHNLLRNACQADDADVANWLHRHGLLAIPSIDLKIMVNLTSHKEIGLSPVVRRALMLVWKDNPTNITSYMLRTAAVECAICDDADGIHFLDTTFNTYWETKQYKHNAFILTKTEKTIKRDWPPIATLHAAQFNSKKVLAWALGRVKDPRALVNHLLKRCGTQVQVNNLKEALQDYIAVHGKCKR